MAKKETGCDFNLELKKLKGAPPQRIYVLYGEEDYLRNHFLAQLKAKCLPEGEDSFSFRRFDGPGLDAEELARAIDVMPFLTERTMVELRDVDLNRLGDADRFLSILAAVPDYCTVCFVQDTRFEPDGRLKLIKYLKQNSVFLQFCVQGQDALSRWIDKRFAALGKQIGRDAKQRLVLISGDLMNRLIPEIEKIAAYASEKTVTVADVEAAASHIPEADVFEMVNLISEKKFDAALHILAELLKNKDNAPVAILASLSYQLRRIYGVKLALQRGKRQKDIRDLLKIRWDFIADRLILSAGRFSMAQLRGAVAECVEAEYKMKSSSGDDAELLKEIFIHLILGDAA